MSINFTKADLLILIAFVVVALSGHYLNSSSMSTPFIYVETLLVLLLPLRRIRFFLLLFILAMALIGEASIHFGFANLFVGFYVLANNFQYLGYMQKMYILFGFLIFIFLSLFFLKFSAIPVNKALSTSILFSIIPLIIGLYQAERSIFVSVNLIGRIPFESLASQKFDGTRVVEKNNHHLSLNTRIMGAKNVYVFILESLGVFVNDDVNKYFSGLIKNKTRSSITYRVEKQFSEGTLGGELRVFCGFKLNNLNVTESIPEFNSCIPNTLKSQGWRTTVVHPGPRGIYNRPIVYNAMGFERYFSAENLGDVTSCGGGWAGAPCDSLVISEKLNRYIDPGRKNLLYFLSINSHHPYTNENQEIQICEKLGIEIGLECSYFSHLMSSFKAIGDFIEKNEGYYYITGDHSAPGLVKLLMSNVIPIYEIEVN